MSIQRKIRPQEAVAAWKILMEIAGASVDKHEEWAFVRYVTEDNAFGHEYRFMGRLGFGGKFRNNGNREGIPYVDYYPENRTAERDVIVAECNAALAKLFGVQS